MTRETAEGALLRAIEAAEVLGLETDQARSVVRTIEEREGYPSDLYVLALAGGTGVGKSSLLNAMAADEVSPAGARRPTTTAAVALLPAGWADEAAPLLAWLGGAEARTRPDAEGPAVAIVDLPDLDSVEPAHAARVDAVLPRVDAVLWVTDPEKYDDAVLHDRYLRRWMPRLAHQAVVVNKADRLGRDDMGRVCEDLRERLRAGGLPDVPVLAASAHRDIEAVRGWLQQGASAKEIVRARLRQSAVDAAVALAMAAGVAGPAAPGPLVAAAAQEGAVAAARDAILDLIGPGGLRAQAAASTRAAAAAVGGGPLQRVRTLLDRGAGVTGQRADPEGYLRRWRDRGSLDRAVAPIRQLLVSGADALPADLRPAFLANAAAAALGVELSGGIDAAIGRLPVPRAPHSRLWPAIGLGQLLATAAWLVGVIWLITLFVTAGATPSATVDLPILGPMPMPAALIIGGLLATFALGRLLHWHAGRLGRRWADDILDDVSRAVSAILADGVARRLAITQEARLGLWNAARAVERGDWAGRRD